MVEAMVLGGLRRCEVLGLDLVDVGVGERRVFVADGKGRPSSGSYRCQHGFCHTGPLFGSRAPDGHLDFPGCSWSSRTLGVADRCPRTGWTRSVSAARRRERLLMFGSPTSTARPPRRRRPEHRGPAVSSPAANRRARPARPVVPSEWQPIHAGGTVGGGHHARRPRCLRT